jgi:hypothetical protein
MMVVICDISDAIPQLQLQLAPTRSYARVICGVSTGEELLVQL